MKRSSGPPVAAVPSPIFLIYPCLFAFRDISLELFLAEDPVAFSLVLSVVVTTIGLVHIGWLGGLGLFFQKLRIPRVFWHALVLGAINGLLYALAFTILKIIGAGVFNLIEFGLAPILLAGIGVVVFKEKAKWTLAAALGLYLVGIWCLFGGGNVTAWQWALLALISPFATAISDGLTKSLSAAGLTRQELLVVRFMPAVPALLITAFLQNGGVTISQPGLVLWVCVAFGYLPLYLLVYLIERVPLSRLAVWDFLIPTVAFFGTLHAHPENQVPRALIGAFLILSCVVVGDLDTFRSLLEAKLRRPTPRQGGHH